MFKRVVAVLSALIIPYMIFSLVFTLNESDLEVENDQDKQVNFDVKKQQQLKKPKPKPKKEKRRRQAAQKLPTIKPSDVGSSLSGSGLSFGLPQFDEAEFEDIKTDSLLDFVDSSAMDNDSVDTSPKVVRRSPIVYPELARRQGISGYVTMNVLIDELGNVEDVEIIDSKPKEIFDLKADTTVRRWKFEPATYNGKKVKVWAVQKIVFKLTN